MISRIVEFTVAGEAVAPGEMTRLLGTADQVTIRGVPTRAGGRPARENAWTLRADGGPDTDIDALVEATVTRVAALEPGLRELAERGCSSVLRVVQYMSRTDPVGPGFALEPEHLALLGRIGAVLDVDLYVRGEA